MCKRNNRCCNRKEQPLDAEYEDKCVIYNVGLEHQDFTDRVPVLYHKMQVHSRSPRQFKVGLDLQLDKCLQRILGVAG